MFDLQVWLEGDLETCSSRRFGRRGKKDTEGSFDKYVEWYRTIVWSHFLKYKVTQLSNARHALVLNGNDTTDILAEQVLQRFRNSISKALDHELATSAELADHVGSDIVEHLQGALSTATFSEALAEDQPKSVEESKAASATHDGDSPALPMLYGETLERFKDPETLKTWFWNPTADCALYEEDLPNEGWKKFIDVNSDRCWWWNEATGAYFFELACRSQ